MGHRIENLIPTIAQKCREYKFSAIPNDNNSVRESAVARETGRQ
jgi:hypothetical protein